MKRQLVSLIVLLAVSLLPVAAPGPVLAQGTATQEKDAPPPRERINFDRDWRFAFGDPDDPRQDFGHGTGAFFFAKAGYGNGPASAKFDDRAWRKLDLPHDWAMELPHDPKGSTNHGSRAIGIGFPEHNIGWYRKAVSIPQSDRGRRIAIEFDGVYRDYTVWFNGHYIGNEKSGYSGTRYDLTDYVNYGGPNVIAVRVNALVEEGWYYEGAGIYRHVWMTKTDPLHVGHWGVFVSSEVPEPHGTAKAATIAARTTIDNDGDAERRFTIDERIVAADGRSIAAASQSGSVAAKSSADFASRIMVDNPVLWSVETPVLHTLVTTIRDGERIVDRYETRFGIRTVRFDPDSGFWLNGRNIKLKGTNNHQDHAGLGVALPDAMQEYRLRRLQAMGANAYRTSHHPPTPELLDAADRLGMLVIDEHRMMGTTPEIRDQLHRLIRRDRNHPSVVLWSIGNEEWAMEGGELGARLTRAMQDDVRRIDPTRRVTVAISGGSGHGSSTTTDVMGFNYRTQHDVDAYHRAFPGTPALMTEEGATQATRGIYITDPAAVHIAAYDVPSRPSGTSSVQQGWQAVMERPWMAGMFVWTGFDYGGETTPFDWPAVSSQKGMLDTTGAFKDSAWYLASQWSAQPLVHILPHWNWPDRIGQPVPVWIYSNADAVELFLNGRSLGCKPMPRYGHLEWLVPYAPGALVARGYRGGRPYATATVETTGAARRLEIVADRRTLAADGSDVAVLTLRALDAQGRAVPTAQDEIALGMSGEGRIIGVGNGDPGSHEDVRPAERIIPAATSGWQLADADAARAAAAGTINLAGLAWRDPFAYHPPGTGPVPTDRFVLRGEMTLDDAPGTQRSLFLPALAKEQAVFVDGRDLTALMQRDGTGYRLPLDTAAARAGPHTIALVVRSGGIAALGTLQDIGGGGINVMSVQTRRPAAAWRVRLFNGLAQVIVQATDRAGTARLDAVAAGLKPATIAVATVRR